MAKIVVMKKQEPADEAVKTTIRMPRRLWLAARTRALEEGRDFQDLVASAIDAYLKTPSKEAKR
jgi:hypothetical protein